MKWENLVHRVCVSRAEEETRVSPRRESGVADHFTDNSSIYAVEVYVA